MAKKRKLLIVEQGQLGGLTDSIKWCQYLGEDYDITHIGLYRPEPVPDVPAHVVRVSTAGPRALRGLRLLLTAARHILFMRGPVIVVCFPQCEWLKRLMPWRRMHLDVRTMSVFTDARARDAYDAHIRAAAAIFDTVTAITPGVARALGRKEVGLLPLGADVISATPKNYNDGLRLLYVGALYGRRIDDTLRGLALFRAAHPQADVRYTIVGDGDELAGLKSLAASLGLDDIVTFAGRVPYQELQPYFDAANVGVSYVPIVGHYRHQPPTKTYEYLLSGLYSLATDTEANRSIFFPDAGHTDTAGAEDKDGTAHAALSGGGIEAVPGGVLHGDSPEAFAAALAQAAQTLPTLKSSDFPDLSASTWRAIVTRDLKPLLDNWR